MLRDDGFEQVRQRVEKWFMNLNDTQKEEIIKLVVNHRPAGRKLSDIMGLGQADKTFDLDLVNGQLAESAFLNIATSGKHEVKRDFKVSESGKIAIELENDGRPSGIAISKSPFTVYWLSGGEYQDEVAIVITTKRLKCIAETGFYIYGGDDKKSLVSLVSPESLVLKNSEIQQLRKRKGPQIKLF